MYVTCLAGAPAAHTTLHSAPQPFWRGKCHLRMLEALAPACVNMCSQRPTHVFRSSRTHRRLIMPEGQLRMPAESCLLHSIASANAGEPGYPCPPKACLTVTTARCHAACGSRSALTATAAGALAPRLCKSPAVMWQVALVSSRYGSKSLCLGCAYQPAPLCVSMTCL
jgi:hypothetical protein